MLRLISGETLRPAMSEFNHANCNVSECKYLQRAEARKYDANLTWHMAEILPGMWALYSPDRRTPKHIGELNAVIATYKSREPVVFSRNLTAPTPPSILAPLKSSIRINI